MSANRRPLRPQVAGARREIAVALGGGRRGAYVRQGVVVNVAGSTVTVAIDGVNVAGVRVYAHVTGLAASDVVDLLVQGSDIRVLGKLA